MPLQMHLVADAVAGAREVNAVFPCHRLNVAVVVRVLKTGLQGVVVDVRHAPLGLHPVDSHGFEFQIRHGSGRILCQSLINPQTDLLPPLHFSRNQVCADDFLRNRLSHDTPLTPCNRQ